MSNGTNGKGLFSSTGVTVGTTPQSKADQKSNHLKGNKVTMGKDVPRQAEGAVGDITVRDVSILGLRCYIKTDSGWYDINTMQSANKTEWLPMPLVNNWETDTTYVERAEYFKDPHGFVHLRGKIQQSSGSVTATICTMPAGFRPPAKIWRFLVKAVRPTSTTQIGVVEILSTGVIATTSAGAASASLMDLEGITYFAGQSVTGSGAGSSGSGGGGGGSHVGGGAG